MASNNTNISMNKSNVGAKSGNGKEKNMFGMVLVGVCAIVILYFIYSIIKGYRNYSTYSPYFVRDIIAGNTALKIDAWKIPQPMDNQYGTEFSYSFWIYVKDTNFDSTCDSGNLGAFKHVFHKGSNDHSNNHLPLLQNAGVWLYPNTNKFHIRFNTYQNITESCDVGNIPINAWTQVSILLIGNSVDVFINGNLKKRQKLRGVPKLNYENLYITNWGGFDGYLCGLRYFNYAIQPFMIEYLFNQGPSQKFDNTYKTGVNSPAPELSSQYWMTVGYPNTIGAPAGSAPN